MILGLLVILMQDWLSHHNLNSEILRMASSSMDFNHNPSLVVRVAAMYSASVEERAMVACFFVRHEMTPPANRNT